MVTKVNNGNRPTLWRRPRVEDETGLGKSQLYHLVRVGDFPRPVKLSDRCSAWIASEVQNWIDSRIAMRDAKEAA